MPLTSVGCFLDSDCVVNRGREQSPNLPLESSRRHIHHGRQFHQLTVTPGTCVGSDPMIAASWVPKRGKQASVSTRSLVNGWADEAPAGPQFTAHAQL